VKKYRKRIIRETANGGFFETQVEVIENEILEEILDESKNHALSGELLDITNPGKLKIL
jgi:hypothetical protein